MNLGQILFAVIVFMLVAAFAVPEVEQLIAEAQSQLDLLAP